jgi:hypothetical protein
MLKHLDPFHCPKDASCHWHIPAQRFTNEVGETNSENIGLLVSTEDPTTTQQAFKATS